MSHKNRRTLAAFCFYLRFCINKTTHSHSREIGCDPASPLNERNGQTYTTHWQPSEKISYSSEFLNWLFKTNACLVQYHVMVITNSLVPGCFLMLKHYKMLCEQNE